MREKSKNFPLTFLNGLCKACSIFKCSLHGYILVYGGRITRRGETEKKGDRARYYLRDMRGVAENRFSIAKGGYREKPMFEIWIVQEGVKPEPSATIDPRYVRFIDRQ